MCDPFGTPLEFPFPYASANATAEAAAGCATPVFNLTDVAQAACCTTPGSRPISTKAFVLTGWTYEDGYEVTGLWGGGSMGFAESQLPFDFVVVAAYTLGAGALAVWAAGVRHQVR